VDQRTFLRPRALFVLDAPLPGDHARELPKALDHAFGSLR